MSEGFFDRWSRRKQQVREGQVPPEPPAAQPSPEVPPEPPSTSPDTDSPGADTHSETQHPASAPPPPPAPPTFADAQGLTVDSDFRPFAARDVAPEVKSAAFKTLFADPHFNVMDGLDTYIDDYSKPSPLPESVLRQMASARFLDLFQDDPKHPEGGPPRSGPAENPEADALPDVAQSQPREEPLSKPV
ncbi:MAG: DUF3306 domain-containing protein, partial [Gammaproteobacteria bacterium]|nr:DUF3306 domain-containing protein [Gammaproteobacteria bacterium]